MGPALKPVAKKAEPPTFDPKDFKSSIKSKRENDLQTKIDKIWQKYKSDKELENKRANNNFKISRAGSIRSIDKILNESLGLKESRDKYADRRSSVTSRQTFGSCLQSESVRTVTERIGTICQFLAQRLMRESLLEYEEFMNYEVRRNHGTNYILDDVVKKLRYSEFLLKNIERKIIKEDQSDLYVSELP